jgi:chromosome segregation ATPase
MIDKQYVESARNIKTEFLSLSKKLDNYKGDLEKLSSFLQDTVKELQNITEKKVTSKDDLTDMANKLVKKLQDVELEEIKITNLVKPINDRIEKLREEENILYKSLKVKYPNMTDDDMKRELNSRI